jgi:hypothetical protein
VATWSEGWDCGPLLAGVAGSNLPEGFDVSLFRVMSVVRQRSLLVADHFSRGVLTSVVYLSVIVKPR